MSKPKAGCKKNTYQMPKKLNRGTKLVDNFKCEWIVGSSIGKGGFGEIYCVSKKDDKIKSEKDFAYVLKIEPHQNGPLFVEMHFYMRNAKYEDINTFKISRKLVDLGIPHFVGSGSHDIEGIKHRFIVLPRYGRDIWSLYLINDKLFPIHTVCRLALQMIDALEYIHNCTYVHGDLKGANMLLKGDSQVYLVDYGLASHYTTNSLFKPDPKKMHNGTIEYTSIDAHYGVPTMRGDMEILGYNLIHWIGGQLPWESFLSDVNKVKDAKEKLKNSGKAFEKQFSSKTKTPSFIQNFFMNTYSLKFNEHPNYDKCRKIFLQELKYLGKSNEGPLQFAQSDVQKSASPKKKLATSSTRSSSTQNKTDNVNGSHKVIKDTLQSASNEGTSVTLSTPSKGKLSKYKKVCNLNIDLDISIDTDVIVNVRRRNKAENTHSDDGVSIAVDAQGSNGKIDQGPEVSSRKRKHIANSSDENKAKNLRKNQSIPKATMRAGEYKGKKSKQ
ncbi:serine/threonine-protein kinase VRK1 [Culicoides brevitarsis]|uniref:serine/threonine-protein kinase VRK1 n=1 Tax=Culicoides brevitarsis TaxID=469753 RepID=UPI00307C2A51